MANITSLAKQHNEQESLGFNLERPGDFDTTSSVRSCRILEA